MKKWKWESEWHEPATLTEKILAALLAFILASLASWLCWLLPP